MAASSGAIRAGKAFVELFADDGPLQKTLKKSETTLKAWGKSVSSAGKSLLALGGASLAPLAGSLKVFADMGSEMNDMSARTGVSVEALSTLGFAAKQTGADAATLEGGMRKMSKTLSAADDESKKSLTSLAKLGLELGDLQGKSPDEQFRLIGERLAQISDPTKKAAAAMEIFGKSGTQLLPMFAEGAAGLAEMEARARELGLEMSSKDAAAADTFGDKLDELWGVIKMGAFQVGAALAPAMQQFVDVATTVIVKSTAWLKENKALVVTVAAVAAGIAAAGAALIGLGAVLTAGATALGAIAALLGAIVSPVGLVIASLSALGYSFIMFTETGQQALGWLMDKFNELKTDALKAFGGIADALSAGDIDLAMRVAGTALKLEWTKAVGFLEEKWIEFKSAATDIAIDLGSAIAGAMITAFAEIQKVWNKTEALIAKGVIEVEGRMHGLSEEQIRFAQGLVDVATGARNGQVDTDAAAQRAAAGAVVAGLKTSAAGEKDRGLGKLAEELRLAQEAFDAAVAEAAGNRKDQEEGKHKPPIEESDLGDSMKKFEQAGGVKFEDLRTKEGFESIAKLLRGPDEQEKAYQLQNRQFIEQRRTREAVEAITVKQFR